MEALWKPIGFTQRIFLQKTLDVKVFSAILYYDHSYGWKELKNPTKIPKSRAKDT